MNSVFYKWLKKWDLDRGFLDPLNSKYYTAYFTLHIFYILHVMCILHFFFACSDCP